MPAFRHLLLCAATLGTAIFALSASPAAGETVRHEDHRSFPAKSGTTVRADVSFSDLAVQVRPGSTVEVTVDLEVTASGKRAQEYLDQNIPVFETRENEILIRTKPGKRSWTFNWGSMETRGHIRIEVPPGVSLNLDTASGNCTLDGDLGEGDLEADTASGDVLVKGAARDLQLDTASGDVRIELSRDLKRVEASTASGNVFLTGPVGEARLDTASGDIEVLGLTGSARLDTASGDIVARWDRVEGTPEIQADAASGDVTLHFPPGTRLDGQIETASGDIESDFPGRFLDDDEDSFAFEGGAGAVRVRVDTASGDVTVAAGRGDR